VLHAIEAGVFHPNPGLGRARTVRSGAGAGRGIAGGEAQRREMCRRDSQCIGPRTTACGSERAPPRQIPSRRRGRKADAAGHDVCSRGAAWPAHVSRPGPTNAASPNGQRR
jgi:hypothetical protein